MNYTFKPSLKHIAIVKIVTTLLTQNDMNDITEIKNFSRRNEAENKLIENVKKMSLPEVFEKQLLCAIKPIYDEIILWKDYHTAFGFWDSIKAFLKYHKLVWRSQGTVDKRKTAETCIRFKGLCLETKFRLACMYCLDKDIQLLWNLMPEDLRQLFSTESDRYALVFKLVMPTNANVNELRPYEKSESAQYQFEFLNAALNRNKVALQYFWNKLEPGQKDACVVRATVRVLEDTSSIVYKGHYFGETLCFLLSQMSDKQQTEMFQISPYNVLESLLEWPRQNFFLETLNRMWNILPVYGYRVLVLVVIPNKITKGYKDCNYREIFEECWQCSPPTHKKFVFNDISGLIFLYSLFQTKDKKCILWILKDATTEQKCNLLCTETKELYKRVIGAEEWDLLEPFVWECISSKDENKCTSPEIIIH